MDALQVATLLIAVGALALSLVNTVIQAQVYRRDRPDVVVTTKFGQPTINAPDGERRMSDEAYVLVMATNKGRQPVSVTGMSLETTEGTISLIEPVPGQTMPATLQPGDYRSMWIRVESVIDLLTRKGGHLTRAVVHGPGDQRWATTELRGVGKLAARAPDKPPESDA